VSLRVEWLGRVPYADAHARMSALLADRIAGAAPDTLLLCEHDPVFTVGRSRGAGANVLQPDDVPVLQVERGGDVTFHGPGQLVGYPICALPDHRHDLHAWLHGLEHVCVETLAPWGISGGADARNTGVWVDGQKIAAIGIACRRWVTWHGFAINVSTDLSFFDRINPCGMESTLVTSMAHHLDRPPRLTDVRDAAGAAFRRWWRSWSEQPSDAAVGGPTG
jgi:lipoyl(octanoyl) transferase